jgi:hypothetical protein
MRTRIVVDSATPGEVYNLTLAFQRTLGFPLPQQLTNEPTVTVQGSAMGWRSPALTEEHVVALLAEYHRLNESALAPRQKQT